MATGTGSQVLDDLAAALGCSVSTVDDDEDSLVSAPATKTCPPSPGGVEQTGNDEWFPETERARKDAAVYLGLEDEAPAPPPQRSRLPLLLAVLVAFVAALATGFAQPVAIEPPKKQPRVQASPGRKPLSSR